LVAVESSLQEVGRHRVKVSVTVPPDEAKPVLDLAYRHLAGSINVPGFRKGKAPRKVVEAQVGRGSVLQEFLEHALPEFYYRALREHELAPIADPEFDDVQVAEVESTGLSFTATVDVRPRITFSEEDYRGIRIERPVASVTEAEVDEQLERLRERFAELETVGHPARKGDYVLADIRSYIHEEEIPELTGQDVLYEVGTEAMVPELDKELEGARRGDILKLNASLPERFGERAGREVAFQVLVKEIKSKRLPALDEGFARTASEFETLEELRADIREKFRRLKEAQTDARIRDEALRLISEKVTADLPDRLIDQETESRVQSAQQRAELQGTTLEAVLQASDIEELQFRSDARAHAIKAVKADLALEAVARAEGIRVGDEELDRAVQALAREVGRSPKEVRQSLDRTGQITSLAGDIIRDKALTVVVEHAEVVGDDGSEPEPPQVEEGKDR
jgi:trigger factor